VTAFAVPARGNRLRHLAAVAPFGAAVTTLTAGAVHADAALSPGNSIQAVIGSNAVGVNRYPAGTDGVVLRGGARLPSGTVENMVVLQRQAAARPRAAGRLVRAVGRGRRQQRGVRRAVHAAFRITAQAALRTPLACGETRRPTLQTDGNGFCTVVQRRHAL
jgi:hypothetical protein